MKNIVYHILSLILLTGSFIACNNVEDGIEINYGESTAELNVELITADRGAKNETISYTVSVSADSPIKSVFVSPTVAGTEESGFKVASGTVDPFVNHDFGTIQPGTYNMDLVYHYTVSQDTVDARLVFTMVDETGVKRDTQKVVTVPAIQSYYDISLYAKSQSECDGFSSVDGMVYHNLADYQELNAVNQAVQEALDIVFVVQDGTAVLTAPYDGAFSSSMNIKNKTVFKKISGLSADEFEALNNASLSSLVEEQSVKKGSTSLSGVSVGDIIGFRTDFGSANAYMFGIMRINELHPTNSEYYDDMSYVMVLDVKVQQD